MPSGAMTQNHACLIHKLGDLIGWIEHDGNASRRYALEDQMGL